MDDVMFVSTSLLMIPHEEGCRINQGSSACTCTRQQILQAWGRLVDRLKES